MVATLFLKKIPSLFPDSPWPINNFSLPKFPTVFIGGIQAIQQKITTQL